MFKKRVIFITATNIDVYWWEAGCLNGPHGVEYGSDGIEQLGNYLKESDEILTYLVFDVVEEEFRNETIPHLYGKDKKDFINRRLNQFYRATPYSGAMSIGREKSGRQDDRLLFAALTNPGLVKSCVDCLLEHKVPIAGIYTPSVLGAQLLSKLNINKENVLLITHQKNSGIRQSYFQGKQLKLSRMVAVTELEGEQYADYIFSEVEKTRRYLMRLNLLPSNETLDVCLLNDDVISNIISSNDRDTGLTRLQVFNIRELMLGLDLDQKNQTRYCDKIFSRMLMLKTPKINYSEIGDSKYRSFRQVRLGMNVLSSVVLVAALVWSTMNIIEGGLLQKYSAEASSSVSYIETEYLKVLANIPSTPVVPAGLKEGVEMAQTLRDRKVVPKQLMQAISTGLRSDKSLEIENIDWIVSADPYVYVNESKQHKIQKPVKAAFKDIQAGDKSNLYQIALISGNLSEFKGNYRDAFKRIFKFAEALKNTKDIIDVQTVKLPLDIDSGSSLHGQAGVNTGSRQAEFIIRVVLKV